MKLAELIQGICPAAVTGPTDAEIRGIAYDSRQIREGYLFLAIPGAHHDGSAFIADARNRGAVAVVAESAGPPEANFTRIRVGDSRLAAAEIACAFHSHPSRRMQVVGVTGTNGKTSIAFMIRDVLAAAGRAPGLVGTIQYQIGERIIPAARTTPEAPDLQSMFDQMLHVGCRSAVMEVSSHSLEQKRVWGIEFDVATFTNLTHDHLDYHVSMERYFEAKKRLFLWLGRGGKKPTAVVNLDDPWGRTLAEMNEIRAVRITYGWGSEAMVRCRDVEMGSNGSRFAVETPWGGAKIALCLLGRFNVSNALAVVASCGALGIAPGQVAEVIARVRNIPGRLEEIPTRMGFLVFVDYAHTDDALSNVLRTLRELTRRRLIVVFGCGGNRDRTKRPAMGAVAAELADFSVLTSDNPRRENPSDILAQVRQGFGERANFEIVEDRAEAIQRALSMAAEGDVVLIAGKGHETYQEFAHTVIPFDDREIARKILAVLSP